MGRQVLSTAREPCVEFLTMGLEGPTVAWPTKLAFACSAAVCRSVRAMPSWFARSWRAWRSCRVSQAEVAGREAASGEGTGGFRSRQRPRETGRQPPGSRHRAGLKGEGRSGPGPSLSAEGLGAGILIRGRFDKPSIRGVTLGRVGTVDVFDRAIAACGTDTRTEALACGTLRS